MHGHWLIVRPAVLALCALAMGNAAGAASVALSDGASPGVGVPPAAVEEVRPQTPIIGSEVILAPRPLFAPEDGAPAALADGTPGSLFGGSLIGGAVGKD